MRDNLRLLAAETVVTIGFLEDLKGGHTVHYPSIEALRVK
jgi:hypothetical protein